MTLKEILIEIELDRKKFGGILIKNFDKQFLYSDQIVEFFLKAIKEKDAGLVDNLLVIAGKDGLDKRYVNILCDLLKVNWHDRYEDIVMTLKKIKDPSSIDCI